MLEVMIQTYRNTLGIQIVKEDDGLLLGMASSLIINPDTGKIEAIKLKAVDPRFKQAILLISDIQKFKTKIYVNNQDDIAELEDIIRITDIVQKNTRFIGNEVRNENEEYLGHVYDLEFDTKGYFIKRIFSEKAILILKWGQREFSYDSILNVEPDFILVKDKQEVVEKKKVRGLLDDKQPLLDV